jgi:pimeloyl-ACP methyl ester carboxylesterase
VDRTPFRAATTSGYLVGWTAGDGPPVLALHGGPGLTFTYLDPAVEEVAAEFRVATFQQRGLAPSTTSGPFTIDQAVADVAAILDHLGWDRAYILGHSWGGHLAFHLARDLAPRLLGVLAVEPLGGIGDGGAAAFGAELLARTPTTHRARAQELDDKDTAGEATEEEALEAFSLVWPAYFAVPSAAPPMPLMATNREASRGLWTDLSARLPALEASLPDIAVPMGVLVGARSPMPPHQAGIATARRIPGAWWTAVPDAGHFTWVEAPGCMLGAMRRLTSGWVDPDGAAP